MPDGLARPIVLAPSSTDRLLAAQPIRQLLCRHVHKLVELSVIAITTMYYYDQTGRPTG